LPPELFIILGAGFGTVALITFYMGKHFADARERYESKTQGLEDLKTIRFEFRGREMTPPLDELYQFLSRTFNANPKFTGVRDIFSNAVLGPKMNDLINRLGMSITTDLKMKDDWRKISSHYGRMSSIFFLLSATSLIGIPIAAFGAYYANAFWNSFITIISLLGIVMASSCLFILFQLLKSTSYKSRYRKAKETYVVDSLRG
jgi:hypothetical protein